MHPSRATSPARKGEAPPPRPTIRLPQRTAVYVVGGGVLLLLMLGVAWWMLHSTTPGLSEARPVGALSIGAPAPDFSMPDLDGRSIQLSALRGAPVWINFWATWCPPCKAEMPRIEEQYRRHQGQGLVVLGVDLQEDPAVVRAWVQDQFHWRLLIDRDLTLANHYDLEGLPGHVFIDRTGIVRGRYAGELDAAQMDAQLAAILPP